MQMNTIYAALAGAERVFEVMDETPEKGDSPDAIESVPKQTGWKEHSQLKEKWC